MLEVLTAELSFFEADAAEEPLLLFPQPANAVTHIDVARAAAKNLFIFVFLLLSPRFELGVSSSPNFTLSVSMKKTVPDDPACLSLIHI